MEGNVRRSGFGLRLRLKFDASVGTTSTVDRFWASLFRPRTHTLRIPTLNDKPEDFNRLFDLLAPIDGLIAHGSPPRVVVEFAGCEFLQQNAVILLGGMARAVANRGGSVQFLTNTMTAAVRENLRKNGFLSVFGGERMPRAKGNAIPYREHGKADKEDVMDYLRREWLGRGWISISDQLRDAIIGDVWEIYTNASEHSESPIGVISCGQFYPKKRRIKLTVVDFGIGIPNNVRRFTNRMVSASSALKWAFTSGTSTKPGGRGLGLSTVKELVKLNGGSLVVYSNDGYGRVDKHGEVYADRKTQFSGTILTVELCSDRLHYCLASEIGREHGSR
jgi:hypothetical protein